MRIAGVDPGTIHAGVGIIDASNRHLTLLFSGTIHAARHKRVSIRLELVYTELKALFEKWQPDVVALENVFYHKNFQSAVKVGEARAAAMIAARSCGISVVEYPPARVKQAVCGNGRASKEQVQYMVGHLLNLRRPLDPDSADALAVALCYLNMKSFEIIGGVSVPAVIARQHSMQGRSNLATSRLLRRCLGFLPRNDGWDRNAFRYGVSGRR